MNSLQLSSRDRIVGVARPSGPSGELRRGAGIVTAWMLTMPAAGLIS